MRCIQFALLASTVLLSTVMPAQQAGSAPTRVDATLSTPVASLTPDQIASMQVKLADWPQLERYRAANAALPAPAPGE